MGEGDGTHQTRVLDIVDPAPDTSLVDIIDIIGSSIHSPGCWTSFPKCRCWLLCQCAGQAQVDAHLDGLPDAIYAMHLTLYVNPRHP